MTVLALETEQHSDRLFITTVSVGEEYVGTLSATYDGYRCVYIARVSGDTKWFANRRDALRWIESTLF